MYTGEANSSRGKIYPLLVLGTVGMLLLKACFPAALKIAVVLHRKDGFGSRELAVYTYGNKDQVDKENSDGGVGKGSKTAVIGFA